MGHLNSDSITVDAILTKHGRYKLSLGGGLDIQHFALSDDGMDYSLWNNNHPSGSDSYGEALTSLPTIEAVPDNSALMRYKLYHGDRDTVYWPVISNVKDITFNNTTKYVDIIPRTEQGNEENYFFIFSNANIIRFDSPNEDAGKLVGGTDLRFPERANMPRALEFHAKQMRIYAKSLDVQRSTTVQIIGATTGAQITHNIVVNASR